MTQLRTSLLACLLLSAGFAHALGFPDFEGTWRIERSSSPEWIVTPMQARADLLGTTITFEAAEVQARTPIGCGQAAYEIVESPPQGLFQGALDEPVAAANAARALKLSDTSAPTLRVTCDTGSFDYHLDETGGLVIMLDNVIYHLKRESAADNR